MPTHGKYAAISQGSKAEAKEAGKVIRMAKRMCIKEMYEEGKSKNEISRRLGLNYRTVSKYAEMDDWNDDKLPSLAPENYPILGGFIPLIDEWLEADKTDPRKQRRLCSEFSVNARFHGKTVHILRSSEPEAEAEPPPLAARSVLDRLA